MDWNGMRVLVTGGAGQIGSHLVARLVDAGADVTVADNLWRGKLSNLHRDGQPIIDLEKRFLSGDLSTAQACELAVQDQQFIYHLADVVAGINYVFANQFTLLNTNMLIDQNMLRAAIAAKVPRYVYVGSACSYPADRQSKLDPPPFREEEVYPAAPESSYGWSKLMGEYAAERAALDGLLEVGLLRFHNVYGPHCELSPEKSQVIPALIRKAIRHPHEEFVVWGSGKQRRAFVFVDDAVDGLLRVAERGMNKGAIQIGPDYSTSIRTIAECAVRASGRDIPIRFDTNRPEGDMDRCADWTKAREVLGWAPRTTIEEGVRLTYAWCERMLASSAPASAAPQVSMGAEPNHA
jgi:GDP-D-mannose 3', 5'-epimerase